MGNAVISCQKTWPFRLADIKWVTPGSIVFLPAVNLPPNVKAPVLAAEANSVRLSTSIL